MFKNKYRIIKDKDGWFIAQCCYWWIPLMYVEIGGRSRICNIHRIIEEAEDCIERHKSGNQLYKTQPKSHVVKYVA